MKRTLNFFGTMLPSGNIYDFPDIDTALRDLKVNYQVLFLKTGGRAYKIHKREIQKLPQENHKYYLPAGVKGDGYSLGPVGEEYPFGLKGTWVTVNWEFMNDLFHLPRQGYVTLLIPDLQVRVKLGSVDYPELSSNPEWFWKEKDFLCWSKEGYLANKDKIKKNFELALKEGKDRTNGRGWAAFEEYAERFYRDIKHEN